MKASPTSPRSLQPIDLGSHSGPLRLVAFSDYRIQDISLLLDKLRKLKRRPDLVLYAGDDIKRFRPSNDKNLFEAIASCARYGLCAIAGNADHPSLRNVIGGKAVSNVYIAPAILGRYAVLGIDGAPRRRGIGMGPNLHSEREILNHLRAQRRAIRASKIIVLSHAPPDGILDEAVRFSRDGKPSSIGSLALKRFVRTHQSVVLVVCGHVHRCGGIHKRVAHTMFVNAASHDDFGAVGRLAIIDLKTSGKARVQWEEIREVLSVVPGIGQASAERLRAVGIRSVQELAEASIGVLNSVPHLGDSPEILKARAQAMTQKQPILLGTLHLPTVPELFLDIETDLLQAYIWLIGLCAGRNGEYVSFFAEAPGDEKKILIDFLNLARRFPSANFLTCSGSRFDKRVIESRLSHHGLDTSVCDRIVDLYWIIQRSVALPISSNRVKEIGGFFGFRHRHSDLDGFEVAVLYENYYLRSEETRKRRQVARKLLEYNEDDVRCLPFILTAIERLQGQS